MTYAVYFTLNITITGVNCKELLATAKKTRDLDMKYSGKHANVLRRSTSARGSMQLSSGKKNKKRRLFLGDN